MHFKESKIQGIPLRTIIKSQAFKDFAFILLFLGLITLIFNTTRLDIILQSNFYRPGEGWFLKFKPFWDYFYRFGIFPGYLFGLAGLIMIALSYWNSKYIRYRRAALMLVYTLVLGPGLIINLGLKDHWGRPRPFEVKEFGGKRDFLCACVPGGSDGGKSFPCGHCSMGFFLAVPYLIFRRKNLKLAYIFLISGIAYGILIGLSRMIAGGHFPSDVLWSGGLVWLVALTGVYIFKLDKPYESKEFGETHKKNRARLVTLIVSLLILMITVGIILATPYISEKSVAIPQAILLKNRTIALIADLKDATVEINDDSCLRLAYKVNAFGFPNSKIRGKLTNGDTMHYQIQWMGWFTEVANSVSLGLPAKVQRDFIIKVNKGNIFCNLPDDSRVNFNFTISKGDLFLTINTKEYDLCGDSSQLVNNSGQPIHWVNPEVKPQIQNRIKFGIKKGRVFLQKKVLKAN
jgi:lipid A 4'-phosphatase